MNVLLAEDDPINRKLLNAQLESEGFTVFETSDGEEALAALRRERFDVVISDILMPNMDGFRLCQEIRNDERLSQIPFILYTSTHNSQADRQLADVVGADCFLAKPAQTAVMLEAIDKAMQRTGDRVTAPLSEHDENYVLKRYSEVLVRKLETKNAELEIALREVSDSHEIILQLNAELESRVERRTRELADANRELEAYSFSVSHDLRAPLRRIGGFVGLLEPRMAELLDDDARFALASIRRAVTEMGNLINDLLAFSRAGRVELTRKVVDLELLVSEVLGSMPEALAGRHIEWERQPLPRVWGDESLLRQVFVNLLDNAVKYTRPRATAHIQLSCHPLDRNSVLLCVRDDGVGFDATHAARLFGVFQRLHRSDEFEGTGIGLAIVRRILDRHNGRIWAESTVGQGAAFFFTLHAA